MGRRAVGQLAVVVADDQLTLVKMIELPVTGRPVYAAAIAESQIDKSGCNPPGGQVADNADGM